MHTPKHTIPVRALLPCWRGITLVCLALICLASGGAGAATSPRPATTAPIVLYDGSLNTKPDDQGWKFLALNGSTTAIPVGGATALDTSGKKGIWAGYLASEGGYFGSSAPVPALDRAIGYAVNFSVQVELEDHAGSDKDGDGLDDRAGFSLIVVSSDKRAIELGFWKDRIWAQADGAAEPPAGPLFTQAEGAAFNTQVGRIPYTLVVQGDAYTLSSTGAPILSGKLRDYSAFNGLPDPYETPNLIFLGDDTASASAKIDLAYVAAGPIGDPSLDRKVFVPLLTRL